MDRLASYIIRRKKKVESLCLFIHFQAISLMSEIDFLAMLVIVFFLLGESLSSGALVVSALFREHSLSVGDVILA